MGAGWSGIRDGGLPRRGLWFPKRLGVSYTIHKPTHPNGCSRKIGGCCKTNGKETQRGPPHYSLKPAPQRMNSVSKPRCARGTSCYHVRNLRSEKPATVADEGDFCQKCREESGGHGPSSTSPWMDEVIAIIEMVFEQRPTPQRTDKAVWWDLFDLDSSNGGWKKYSDRGAVLMRLDAKTLRKLRDWLEEHKQEAIERYDERQYKYLHRDVSLMAALSS